VLHLQPVAEEDPPPIERDSAQGRGLMVAASPLASFGEQ
jgi:hypothetical protein